MQRTTIKEIFQKKTEMKNVRVCGWVRNLRASNVFGFIDLNDGSCFGALQIVFEANNLENYSEIASQNIGAALLFE